jgi:hypothetical protein
VAHGILAVESGAQRASHGGQAGRQPGQHEVVAERGCAAQALEPAVALPLTRGAAERYGPCAVDLHGYDPDVGRRA